MGLCIYYTGRFRKDASLPEMIDEVSDIADTYKWDYHIFEREFPPESLGKKTFNENIYGILFSPPKCEAITLCFLSNGKMGNPFMLDYYLKSKKEEDRKLIFNNFTKTQYAGIEVHKIGINILRHISKKYLQDFQVMDEGQYWESNDVNVLEMNFAKYDALVSGFAAALENSKQEEGETLVNFIVRVANKVYGKGEGNG